MVEKRDPELEEQMKEVLAGFKEMREKEEAKQYKRNWASIHLPFTLHEGLSRYTKAELDDVRNHLDMKGASHLRKAELLSLLAERLSSSLAEDALIWDSEWLDLLINIASHGGYVAPLPNIEGGQINFFRKSGMVYTGTFDGDKVLAVPQDLIEPIMALKNNLTVRAAVKRNTEWVKLTRGLLYYYGTISTNQLISFLEKYTKRSVEFGPYLKAIQNANAYHREIVINGDGFSNYRVFDPKRVKQEHQKRKDLSFYPFTKQELLVAGAPGFIDKSKQYIELVSFLTRHFEMTKEEADGYVEECVYATRIGEGPNEVVRFLAQKFEFDSVEVFQALTEKLIELMNNTREWFLKGYTSEELSQQEKKHNHLVSGATPNPNESNKMVKVRRNDPCPCGSGKKYKKCCGR